MCERCGLLFLSPRMTTAEYERYYEAEYIRQREATTAWMRAEKSRSSSTHASLTKLFDEARRYGEELLPAMQKILASSSGQRVFEIGSGTGGILAVFQEHGWDVTGCDPDPQAVEFSEDQGINSYRGLFEQLHLDLEPFNLIVSIRSLNHLLDPMSVLNKAHSMLEEDGLLFVECLDFSYLARSFKTLVAAIQIDHPYMFIAQTLETMIKRAGFEIISTQGAKESRSKLPRAEASSPWRCMQVLARKRVQSNIDVNWSDLNRDAHNVISELPNRRLRYFLITVLKKHIVSRSSLLQGIYNHLRAQSQE